VIVLGTANLLADGFSMGVSNYLGTKSEAERIDRARRDESHHIRHVPDGEREEIRRIFARKGFSGAVLESIVHTITRNRKLWVDTMITEELGLHPIRPRPLRAGLATFLSFIAAGLVPLIPFLVPGLSGGRAFAASAALTAIEFAAIGIGKGLVCDSRLVRSALETLLNGGSAAALAYLAGFLLKRLIGAI